MTKISQLTNIGSALAADDEFVVRDVSDISTPNKKVTSSGIIDYIIAQGGVSGFTQIAAGVGPLARALASSSGTTGTLVFSTASTGSLLERARIDSAGRFLVGVATARADFSTIAPQFQIENTSVAGARLGLTRNAESAGAAEIFLAKTRSSVNGGSTVVLSGDSLGGVGFWGADGTGLIPGASINGAVDGTPGANDMPGRLVFSTTADGAASPTERMRIDSAGRVLVGTTTANTSGAKLQTSDGLTFPATQVASADPNTLDDYEEGTYTVTLTPSTSGSFTLSSSSLSYTKIGRFVNVRGVAIVSSSASPVGYVTVSLPFVPSGNGSGGDVIVDGATGANSADFISIFFSSSLRIYLGDANGLQSDSAQAIGSSGQVYLNVSYYTA